MHDTKLIFKVHCCSVPYAMSMSCKSVHNDSMCICHQQVRPDNTKHVSVTLSMSKLLFLELVRLLRDL